MKERARRSLHDEIMNLQVGEVSPMAKRIDGEPVIAYKMGHRDARHEAALLASEHEMIVSDLVEALKAMSWRLQADIDDCSRPDEWTMKALVRKAEEALVSAYGETQ